VCGAFFNGLSVGETLSFSTATISAWMPIIASQKRIDLRLSIQTPSARP
jgi:hypothetical protein